MIINLVIHTLECLIEKGLEQMRGWKILQNLINGGIGIKVGLENSGKFNSRDGVEEVLFDTLK